MKTKFIYITVILLAVVLTAFTLADKKISGQVTNSENMPLSGVVVQVKGTKIMCVTDIEGLYAISVPDGKGILIFQYLGMKTIEKNIKDQTVVNATMINEVLLEDIVVIKDSEEKLVEYDEVFSAPRLSSTRSTRDIKASGEGSSRSYDKKSYSKRKEYKKGKKGTTSGLFSSSKKTVTTSLEVSRGMADDASDGSISTDLTTETQKSGQLTAGEIHDFSKWDMWGDITANQLKEYSDVWKIKPEQRYSVQVTTEDGKPVINAEVKLFQKEIITWTARTDNTGKAELWLGMLDKASTKKLSITVNYQGQTHLIKRPSQFHNGINMLEISASCNIPTSADIVFVVDATGSMGDEIAYLKAEMNDVITRIKINHKDITVNLGSVFYRDHGDSYLVRSSDLDSDISKTSKFIAAQNAGGGGDYPEAVEEGLESAINQMSWSSDARAKVIFLVLDAPPHSTPEITDRLGKLTKEAAKKGIRIVPVTASGIDKSTEYLMRSMALATNGTYVFLTDDSGIGGSHIKPTTDEFKVELLNDLLVRLANQYLITPDCDNNLPEELVAESDTAFITENVYNTDTTNINKNDTSNNVKETTDVWAVVKKETIKYYPNPTSDIVNIELLGNVKAMYLADISGKILQRFDTSDQTKFVMSIGKFPSGIYFIQYLSGENWKTGKVILKH